MTGKIRAALLVALTLCISLSFALMPAEALGEVCVAGGTYYPTVQAAVDGIAGTGYITMLNNSSGNVTIPEEKNITIDFGDCILSGCITNNGKLTVKGKSGGISGKTCIFNAGTIGEISGGTFINTGKGPSYVSSCIINNGRIDRISGGVFNGGDGENGALCTSTSGSVGLISGGEFTGICGINTSSKTLLVISGGSCIGTNYGLYIGAGPVEIYGGSFESEINCGAYNNKGTLTVYAGQFKGGGAAIGGNYVLGEGAVPDASNTEKFMVVTNSNPYNPAGPEESQPVTLEIFANAPEKGFMPGEKFTVDVIAKRDSGAVYGSFDIGFEYDSDFLTLLDISTEHSGYFEKNITAGKAAFSINSATGGIAVGPGGTVIVSAIFEIKAGVNSGQTRVSLSDAALTENGESEEGIITGEVEITVQIVRQWTVTFVAGANGSLSGELCIEVNDGSALSGAHLGALVVTPDPGYKFKEWQAGGVPVNPVGYTVNSDVTFTAVFTVDGMIEFILKDEYAALRNGTKIAMFKTGRIDGIKFVLADNKELFWSEAYSAYVCIVASAETEAGILSGMRAVSGEALTINYGGDINGDGKVSSVDAMVVDNILHDTNKSPSDMMRFRADVNGDGKVTTADIIKILRTSVGLHD